MTRNHTITADQALAVAENLTYVVSLAREHTETCINVLAKIVSNEQAPDEARVKAAEVLLGYSWGQPAQPVQLIENSAEGALYQ
jgi:hypothetical protein